MLTLISPAGLQRFFEAVVREGEEEILAQPERLVALAAEFGSEILGDHPGTSRPDQHAVLNQRPRMAGDGRRHGRSPGDCRTPSR
jgi:hypothetical protein